MNAAKKRCAWPNRPLPCDQPARFRSPGSMLDYCHDHYLAMLANRRQHPPTAPAGVVKTVIELELEREVETLRREIGTLRHELDVTRGQLAIAQEDADDFAAQVDKLRGTA